MKNQQPDNPHFLYILSFSIVALTLLLLFYHPQFTSMEKLPATAENSQKENTIKPAKIVDSADSIGKRALDRLDPRTITESKVEAIREKVAQSQAARENIKVEEPLTDIAPSPLAVKVSAKEHPYERLKQMNLPPPAQETISRKLPRTMDLRTPPRWTASLSESDHVSPAPDPSIPPPIKVDMSRTPQTGKK